MSKSHNKKRNIGLIYEQLVNYVSEALVEGRKDDADRALKIINQNFKKGTELYREFRLFNALVKTSVKSDSLASRILSEAKSAAQDHDPIKLRAEKSQLIKEINHEIKDSSVFYARRVDNYRTYATIQTLLNDWRQKEVRDFSRCALYETKIHEWLTTERVDEDWSDQRTPDINRLSVKIMTEKFNIKYRDTLSETQKTILREYAFSSKSEDFKKFKSVLSSVKSDANRQMAIFSQTCDNNILNEKLDRVNVLIGNLDPEVVTDESVSKFLLVCRLCEELKEKKSV
jgi:hypothetical protein